jgi:hypothetical protein
MPEFKRPAPTANDVLSRVEFHRSPGAEEEIWTTGTLEPDTPRRKPQEDNLSFAESTDLEAGGSSGPNMESDIASASRQSDAEGGFSKELKRSWTDLPRETV